MPIHKPKNNHTSFSYAADGRFNCFSCGVKGRGAIDLTKLSRGIGFQDAVSMLEGMKAAPPSKSKNAPEVNSGRVEGPVELDVVPVRECMVSFTDARGVAHSVRVHASTVLEAAGAAVKAVRDGDFATAIHQCGSTP